MGLSPIDNETVIARALSFIGKPIAAAAQTLVRVDCGDTASISPLLYGDWLTIHATPE